MNRKNLWMLALVGTALVAPPATAQTAYSYTVGDDGKAHVWVSAEAEKADGGPAQEEQVKIVVVGSEDGEPQTYEWKTEDGKVITLGGEGNVHFIEDMTRRGYLGVELVDLTPELRQHYGASAETGVLVGKVEEGSPAETAGLQVGDMITALDGEPVGTSWDIRRHVRSLEDGETLSVEAYRDGARLELAAHIVEKERPEVDIRRFIGRQGDDAPFVYRVNPEQMSEAIINLKEHFANPEFRTRIQAFGSHEKELEEKLKALEAKLDELSRKLAEKE